MQISHNFREIGGYHVVCNSVLEPPFYMTNIWGLPIGQFW